MGKKDDDGKKPEVSFVTCGTCGGSGSIKQPGDRQGRRMPCPLCKGTGRVRRVR